MAGQKEVTAQPAIPEPDISRAKHETLVRTARYFVRERHLAKCPLRFDVVATDDTPGKPRWFDSIEPR